MTIRTRRAIARWVFVHALAITRVTFAQDAAPPPQPPPPYANDAPMPPPAYAQTAPMPPPQANAPYVAPPPPTPTGRYYPTSRHRGPARPGYVSTVYEGQEEGVVLSVRNQNAVVSLGTAQGASVGMNVVIYADDDSNLGDEGSSISRRRVGVMEIVRVTDSRCEVELGFGDHVETGMLARLTTAPASTHIIAPSRQEAIVEVATNVTIVAVRNDVGFGALLGSRATYRGHRRYYLEAELVDTGFAYRRIRDGESSTAKNAGFFLSAGFDHRFFALGVGLGVQRVLPATIVGDGMGTTPPPTRQHGATAGFGYLFSGRAGASDGLSARVAVGLADYHGRFELSHLDVTAQVPISNGFFLLAHGTSGFGVTGFAEIDVAAKVLVRGNGGRGSVFVSPAIGWAHLARRSSQFESSFDDGFDAPDASGIASGPAVRVGLEVRR